MNKQDLIKTKLFSNNRYDSRRLKGREKEFEWLDQYEGETYSERIWNVLHRRPVCHCGKKTSYIDFTNGYRSVCSRKCAQKALAPAKSARHSTLWNNPEWVHSTTTKMREAHYSIRAARKLAELAEKEIVCLDEITAENNFNKIYRWQHKCGEVFLKSFKRTYSIYCPKCHVSKGQGQLYELIRKNYAGTILVNDRTAIEPLEIDIYLPEMNLGFEFNGKYWHRGDGVREAAKVFEAQEAGIRLVNIWELEWIKDRKNQELMVLKQLSKIQDQQASTR